MTEVRRSARQDYVLRVRYDNTLPPPSFEPKLLKLPNSSSRFEEASFLSTLIHEQPQRVDLDSELGMPLDLTTVHGAFEEDEMSLRSHESVEVAAKDKLLLKTPHEVQNGKLTADVAFLRRTQYISSEVATTSRLKAQEAEKASKLKESLKIELDPIEQLAAVDKTFDDAQQPLHLLQHPVKKTLKAIEAWSVLPLLDHLDRQYVNAKFPTNPAPKTKSDLDIKDEDSRLEVACLVPRIIDELGTSSDNDYIAYFLPDHDQVETIMLQNDNAGISNHTSHYNFVREYDAKKDEYAAEWAIILEGSSANYIELGGRMNMRGRRRGGQVTDAHEKIQLSMRALNSSEMDIAENIRQQFSI